MSRFIFIYITVLIKNTVSIVTRKVVCYRPFLAGKKMQKYIREMRRGGHVTSVLQ